MSARAALCLVAFAWSFGCYTYVPATLDAVPVGGRVRALMSTEAERRLRDSLGLEVGALRGTLVQRDSSRWVIQVQTATGARAFGAQALYQRIAVSPQDVLRVDMRRMSGLRTGVFAGLLTWVALVVAIEGFGLLRPGTPEPPTGGPPELRRPWAPLGRIFK